jgi:hypothetical protein
MAAGPVEAARLAPGFVVDVAGAHRATADNLRSNMTLHLIGAANAGTPRSAFVSDRTYADQHLWAIVGRLEWARPKSGGHVRLD